MTEYTPYGFALIREDDSLEEAAAIFEHNRLTMGLHLAAHSVKP